MYYVHTRKSTHNSYTHPYTLMHTHTSAAVMSVLETYYW